MALFRIALKDDNPPEIVDYVVTSMIDVEFFVLADSAQAAATVVSMNAAKQGHRRVNGKIPVCPWTTSEWSTCDVIGKLEGNSDPLEDLKCTEVTDVDGAKARILLYRRKLRH
jgi:hypothetical protein